jgi:hypothetical protein
MNIKAKFWKKENYAVIEHNNINYRREEVELEDSITIKWCIGSDNDYNYLLLHYYTNNLGWTNKLTNLLDLNEPIPELEIIYQKLI